MLQWRSIGRKRFIGALLVALGALALCAPLAVGSWSLTLLGIPLILLSVAEAYSAFVSPQRTQVSAYLPSALAMLAGNLLLLSSALVVSGLLILVFALLVIDALIKLVTVWRRPSADRLPIIINACVNFAGAFFLWYLSKVIGAERAVGFIIGISVVAAGWRLLLVPPEASTIGADPDAPTVHPDHRLELAPNDAFAKLRVENERTAHTAHATDLMWMLTLGGVFLAIHLGRMPISDTLLGIVSPFVATAGDLLMTVAFAALVVLPFRLLWRRLTRPIERLAWSLQFRNQRDSALRPFANWVITGWLANRYSLSTRLRKARGSLRSTLLLLLRLGLPVTAFFVAFNPIWGFSWYFNTESWATGVYQKMTELRVDTWRLSMIEAVQSAYPNVGDELFRVRPDGIDGTGDFSFLVIGDSGEGDPSQFSLVSRYLALGLRDDVKFLVVASDVIYPAGSIDNYESNFYLPFQGFAKPIYAIPGNHDWFDALEGFNANLLEPKAARAAIEARVKADLGLTSTTSQRIDRLLMEAARFRRLYSVNAGTQRATFFEVQTNDFALLAIDTGILRSVDERQWAWLEQALSRSRGKFTMAIVGHPRFAGGYDTTSTDEARADQKFPKSLAALYRILAMNNVKIAMAGDTHDFEYYKEKRGAEATSKDMHHFVNGGGGAYLSIGTALDFPRQPAVADWAFYPRSDHLRDKMASEMPLWKQPFWQWIKWLNAWPFSVEALSGIFDFNHAPFFQSFMEVRVERSKRRVVLSLNGVNGPLHWRDLQIGGTVLPSAGSAPDDPVEFIVDME